MHLLAGAQAAAHAVQRPSTAVVQCLYVRSLTSYMQLSAGVHAAPKWKHAPSPPARHVKYVAVPAWYAQLVAMQPMSGTGTAGAAGATAGCGEGGDGGAIATPTEPDPEALWTGSVRRSAGWPHPRRIATMGNS
jgi:hypothetical protein